MGVVFELLGCVNGARRGGDSVARYCARRGRLDCGALVGAGGLVGMQKQTFFCKSCNKYSCSVHVHERLQGKRRKLGRVVKWEGAVTGDYVGVEMGHLRREHDTSIHCVML